MGKKRKRINTPAYLATNHKQPKNFWILGTRFADEEPVILGTFKPSNKPICCSLQNAEAIASRWASLPDIAAENTQPLYKEVAVILAISDGKGGWDDPTWCDVEDIKSVVRPGHFEAFGQQSKLSQHSMLREKLVGDKGIEYTEDPQAS